jgi:UDP-N-acetylglucosamine--N-acetylmuramyl-(pentapeptide) pyrophosphoryl-undecaprenol N-acetylglucosamine transferase
VTFIGARKGLEAKVVTPLGFDLITLPVRGVMGSGVVTGIWRMIFLITGSLRAFLVLGRLKPDLVIGVGGYASIPGVVAAAMRGIPRSILEQNVMPGRANRVLARLVQRIYQGFASRSEFFPTEKTVITGNPIREGMLPPADLERPPGRKNLLILGGSQGAKQINDLALAFVPRLKERFPDLKVLHQSGPYHEKEVRAAYGSVEGITVAGFITDMSSAYGGADLCISRAGAMAVSELAGSGLPAILIPFPGAAGGHQDLNARWFEERGGAVAVPTGAATPQLLYEAVSTVLETPHVLGEMTEASRRAGVRDAAEKIARLEMERIGYSGHRDAETGNKRKGRRRMGKVNIDSNAFHFNLSPLTFFLRNA